MTDSLKTKEVRVYNPTQKALFYAAQAPNPYEVSKFLLEQKCQLHQENVANLQPIHALLANDKVTSKEIVDTIGLYRINGNEARVIDFVPLLFSVIYFFLLEIFCPFPTFA